MASTMTGLRPNLSMIGHLDFDTGVVDQIIERLTVLGAQMKPGLPPAN